MTFQANQRVKHAALAFPLIAMLAACGGGSDSNTASVSATFQTKVASDNLQAVTKTYTVTGTGNDGATYGLTFARAPASVASAFFPTAVSAANVNLIFQRNGIITSTSNSTGYSDATSTPLGVLYADNSCVVKTASTAPTVTGKVGDVVSSFDGSLYLNCNSTAMPSGYISSIVTVESSDGINFFCSAGTGKDANRAVLTTTKICIEIDASGAIKDRAKVTLLNVAANLTVNAKNY